MSPYFKVETLESFDEESVAVDKMSFVLAYENCCALELRSMKMNHHP